MSGQSAFDFGGYKHPPRTPPVVPQDAPKSAAARDAGIAQVAASNDTWMAVASRLLSGMHYAHDEATGEDVRAWLLERGLPQPTHPNAWGALINWAVKRGVLDATGEWRPMKAVPSHARKTPVYRVLKP